MSTIIKITILYLTIFYGVIILLTFNFNIQTLIRIIIFLLGVVFIKLNMTVEELKKYTLCDWWNRHFK